MDQKAFDSGPKHQKFSMGDHLIMSCRNYIFDMEIFFSCFQLSLNLKFYQQFPAVEKEVIYT